MSDSQSDADYFQEVVTEIELEARRRAATMNTPVELLRSLDEEFRRWIPDAVEGNGIEDTIRGIEAASYVNAAVPLEVRDRPWAALRSGWFGD